MDVSTIIIIIAVVLIVMYFAGRMRGGRGPGGGIGDTPAFPGTRGPDRRDPAPGSGGDSSEAIGGEPAGDLGGSIGRDDRDESVVDDIERDRDAPEKKRL